MLERVSDVHTHHFQRAHAIIIDHDVNGAPWRFGASFSGVKVVECLFLLVCSTMGRAVYTEKGSCRHCVDNGLMERDSKTNSRHYERET